MNRASPISYRIRATIWLAWAATVAAKTRTTPAETEFSSLAWSRETMASWTTSLAWTIAGRLVANDFWLDHSDWIDDSRWTNAGMRSCLASPMRCRSSLGRAFFVYACALFFRDLKTWSCRVIRLLLCFCCVCLLIFCACFSCLTCLNLKRLLWSHLNRETFPTMSLVWLVELYPELAYYHSAVVVELTAAVAVGGVGFHSRLDSLL